MLIGKIVSVEADESTRKLMAVVEPSVDFSATQELTGVMIICGYVGHTEVTEAKK